MPRLLAGAYRRGVPQPPEVESSGAGHGLVEVADRVWTAGTDRTTVLVAGRHGLVAVDPGSGAALLTAVRRLERGPLVGVVLTHAHAGPPPDTGEPVPVVLHETAAAALGPGDPGVTPVSSVTALDLGDRVVEVVHPGRGHTSGDLVVRVPDADLLLVGDLVAGDGVPSYGPDCWPLDWPASLDLVLQLLGGSGTAVPAHGRLLDRGAVEEQRDRIATVAGTVRDLAARGVPADRALAQGEADGAWPWPEASLAEAVQRGYAHLPRSAKRLPLA